MKIERTSRVTDRFTIESSDGRQFAVVETSRFFRQELYSGGWTPELRDGGALTTTSGLPVNFDDVSGEYTVLTTPPTVCRRR
jgi:hypothetical protein